MAAESARPAHAPPRARAGLRELAALLGLAARMEAIWLLRGGLSSLAWIASDAFASAAGITATFLLAMRFDGIGSWSADEVVFMLGFALLVRGLIDALFGQNISHISRRIGRGQLDHQLVQPRPLWLTLLSEGFAPLTGAINVAAGLGVLAWSAWRIGIEPSPLWLAGLALNVVAALCVLMAFAFAWGSLAFWLPRGAEEINTRTWGLIGSLMVFPLEGVGGLLQLSLLTWIPAGLVAWVPARALVRPEPGLDLLAAPLASLALVAFASFVFHRGMIRYGRTGSVRYLDWGFRR